MLNRKNTTNPPTLPGVHPETSTPMNSELIFNWESFESGIVLNRELILNRIVTSRIKIEWQDTERFTPLFTHNNKQLKAKKNVLILYNVFSILLSASYYNNLNLPVTKTIAFS